MPELVSILIPAYNAEKWVAEAIKSALAQDWANKEIIVVNDGSKDRTLTIAKFFEPEGVKVLDQENRGASAARNLALSHARGDFIQWLDADDILAPNKVSAQMRVAKDERSRRVLYTSAHGSFYWKTTNSIFVGDLLWQDLEPIDWLITNFSHNIWMSSNAWLVSRELTDLAGPWDESLSLNDDGEYFSRLVSLSEKIKFVGNAKSFHRKSGLNSLSLSTSEKACKSLLLSMRLCIQYLRGLEESERTRMAGVALLQKYFGYFFPDKIDLIAEANSLAIELGGKLNPPQASWKIALLSQIIGRELADTTMAMLRKLRFSAVAGWDKIYTRAEN